MSARLRRAIVLVLAGLAGNAAAGPVPTPPPAPEATINAPATTPAPIPEATSGEAATASPAAPVESITASSVAPELTAPVPPPPADIAAPTANTELAPAVPTLAMTSGDVVFSRLRANLNPNACTAGSNSARWRERYAGSPSAFSHRLESVLPLIDFVSAEVERAGLPAEFTFIPLVESWYQPGAVGPGGPAGMWQMIPTTARNHGIHIRDGYDGRLSPVESTRAALSYLKVLQDMFGDWQAIVMAYNAGEGRMQHALQRAGSRTTSAADRRPHGLSNITYDYVDKLQALSCLVLEPHHYGVHLPVDTKFEPLVPLLMAPSVNSIDQFAATNGKDAELLRKLNPGFRNGRVVADVPRLVLSPPGMATVATTTAGPAQTLAVTMASVAALPAQSASAPGPVGNLLADASAPASPFMVPTSLEAPAVEADDAAEAEAAKADAATPSPKPSTHLVRSGESLWSIARLYRLPIEQLRRANGLSSKALVRPGQMLRLVP